MTIASVEVIEPDVTDVLVVPVDAEFSVEVETQPLVIEVETEGFQGPPGTAGASFVYTQASPASTWNINHGLNTVPDVVWMIDSIPGEPVWVDYTVVDLNNISVSWPSPESGKAYLK